jgi:hypothetical protein
MTAQKEKVNSVVFLFLDQRLLETKKTCQECNGPTEKKEQKGLEGFRSFPQSEKVRIVLGLNMLPRMLDA